MITARPHYSRLKSVLKSIREHSNLYLQLIVGASGLLDRYGQIDKIIEVDGFDISDKLFCVLEGDHPAIMADTTANLILKLSLIFERLKPDAVLVHADRYEQLGVALTASYMNLPLVHTQGGEVTGSIDDKVRNAITQLSDLHLCSTDNAVLVLRKQLMNKGKIFNVGCPSIDLAAEILKEEEKLFDYYNDFNVKYGGVGLNIDYSKGFILVVYHPVTTEYELNTQEVQTEILARAIDRLNYQTVWLWPNVDAGNDGVSGIIRRHREHGRLKNVRMVKNIGPEDFLRLMKNCLCMIGNTSAGIREGAFLGTPFVCVSSRQDGREMADNVLASPLLEDYLTRNINKMLGKKFKSNILYGDGHAGPRISRLLDKEL